MGFEHVHLSAHAARKASSSPSVRTEAKRAWVAVHLCRCALLGEALVTVEALQEVAKAVVAVEHVAVPHHVPRGVVLLTRIDDFLREDVAVEQPRKEAPIIVAGRVEAHAKIGIRLELNVRRALGRV